MSKLNILLFLTLDGVTKATGEGHEEDPANKFKEPLESNIPPNGIITATNRRRGEVNTGLFAIETVSDAEPARRKRLKVEQR